MIKQTHIELFTAMHFLRHLAATVLLDTPTDEQINVKVSYLVRVIYDIDLTPFEVNQLFLLSPSMKQLVHGYFNMPGMKFSTTHIAHLLNTTTSNVSQHAGSQLKKEYHSKILERIIP